MKLFTRYNRLNLLVTISIFLLAGIVFYFFIRGVLISQLDDDLDVEKKEIETYVKEHDHLPEIIQVRHQVVSFKAVDSPYRLVKYRIFEAYDSSKEDEDDFRSIDFGIHAAGKEYQVSVMKPMESTENLLWLILAILLSTILILLAAYYIINRVILKNLWRPFFDTLERLKKFSLAGNKPLNLPAAGTDEFKLLNSTLEATTSKASQDYHALKEFTENASHEIQTPLAIINSKLDLLIQDEALSEKQSQALQGIYEPVQKLSRLSEGLLLSARIGNKQFEEKEKVNLKEKLEKKIGAFSELWAGAGIKVISSLEPVAVQMNPHLADILLNNLLSNATKHNVQGGAIHIILQPHSLSVANRSEQPALDTSRLFTKFYTAGKRTGSNGLGLSIIKDICTASGFTVDYTFKEGYHTFLVKFQR